MLKWRAGKKYFDADKMWAKYNLECKFFYCQFLAINLTKVYKKGEQLAFILACSSKLHKIVN